MNERDFSRHLRDPTSTLANRRRRRFSAVTFAGISRYRSIHVEKTIRAEEHLPQAGGGGEVGIFAGLGLEGGLFLPEIERGGDFRLTWGAGEKLAPTADDALAAIR